MDLRGLEKGRGWNKDKKMPNISGIRHPNWKGGKGSVNGYSTIFSPKHPFCHPRGYVYEHRLVMEKYLGRYLKPEERIHHINGTKTDNNIENLKLFADESKHQKFHNLAGSTH